MAIEIDKRRKDDETYMQIAKIISDRSQDDKIKVGAIIVKDNQILSQGWNGTVAGMDNQTRDINGITRKEVVHAEANALIKLARNSGGSNGSTVFSTHSCCYACAALLIQAGIQRVVYSDVYDPDAIKFLEERGVEVEKYNEVESL